MSPPDLLLVEDTLWVLTAPVGLPVYDFAFDLFLSSRRPWDRPPTVEVVSRTGAVQDYEGTFAQLREQGLVLIHTPQQYARCSLLSGWQPLLADLTPASLLFPAGPDPDEVIARVEAELGWPVFLKGDRQTHRHKRSLSIIADPDHLRRALAGYAADPVLAWQDVVCRRFVPLRPVAFDTGGRVPASFEFRTWWWRGRFVGMGRTWWEGPDYAPSESERADALAVAAEAARRVGVAFLIVDVAQTAVGDWIVIECNDGQEGGVPGLPPVVLWRNIVEAERAAREGCRPSRT